MKNWLFLACCLSWTSLQAQPSPLIVGGLERQAELGFRTADRGDRVVVRRLDPNAPAARAGLRDGDVITKIDGIAFAHAHEGQSMLKRLRGLRAAGLAIERDGRARTVRFTPTPRPLEAIPGVRSTYGFVETRDGSRLRTIIAQPEDASAPLRPLLFTQWVSCDTVEYIAGFGSAEILATMARQSGLALVRVERSSDGDSSGPGCHELDYDTEVLHYVEAFDQVLRGTAVDADEVYIYGSSLGSTTAPLVGVELQRRGYDVAGIMVQGGGAVSYLERMINFDRAYLERRPEAVAPQSIHDEMLERIRFHYEYLVEDRDPNDLAGASDAMAKIAGDVLGLDRHAHYGRPFRWHQQAAKRDFLAAWAELDASALVIFNHFDQFEARHGHALIVDTMNRLRPASATLIEQPRVGHSDYLYATIEEAYAFANGVPVWQATAGAMLTWLRPIVD